MRAAHFVALEGYDHVAHVLVGRGGSVDTADEHGQTPLHFAVQRQDISVWFELGADIEAVDINDRTPLYWAVMRGFEAVVRQPYKYLIARGLVKHGANVNALDSKGNTVLHFASRDGRTSTAGMLIENGA